MPICDYRSPFGWIRLRGDSSRLTAAELLSEPPSRPRESSVLSSFAERLASYFGGRPITVERDELDMEGLSAFCRKVLVELQRVGYGRCVSYGELAARIGRDGAFRAVGQAAGRNPFPIFVPCHRIIRADATVGGFAFGGQWKCALLRHEGHIVRGTEVATAGRCRTDQEERDCG